MEKQWRPGEEVPESANYTAFDQYGNNGGSLYLEKGKRFPATQHSGSYYTKNQFFRKQKNHRTANSYCDFLTTYPNLFGIFHKCHKT